MFEVRPEQVGEIQLGIGQLPEQEVADAVLATGTDTQVRQRQVARGQTGLQQIGCDVFRTQVSGLDLSRQSLRCLRDIPLTAVIGGYLQDKSIGAGRHGLGFTHGSLQLWMKTRAIANDAQADVVVVEALGLTTQGLEEQIHQSADLIGRTLPVLAGKGEQGQHFDLGLGTNFNDGTYRIHARFMPGDTRHKAFFRPAIVTIHDDRDMARHRGRCSLLCLIHENATLIRPSGLFLSAPDPRRF